MFVLLNKAFVILADDHFHYYPIKTSTNSLGLRFSPFWEPSHVFSWNWRLIFDVSWKFYYTTVYIGMFLYHLPLVEKLRFFPVNEVCLVLFPFLVQWFGRKFKIPWIHLVQEFLINSSVANCYLMCVSACLACCSSVLPQRNW